MAVVVVVSAESTSEALNCFLGQNRRNSKVWWGKGNAVFFWAIYAKHPPECLLKNAIEYITQFNTKMFLINIFQVRN